MASFDANQTAPVRRWKAVVPSDAGVLASGCRSLYVGGAGNLALKDDKGNVVVFAAQDGAILPFGPTQVMLTGTTATGIVALY